VARVRRATDPLCGVDPKPYWLESVLPQARFASVSDIEGLLDFCLETQSFIVLLSELLLLLELPLE
jgi:hypothetical protein